MAHRVIWETLPQMSDSQQGVHQQNVNIHKEVLKEGSLANQH